MSSIAQPSTHTPGTAHPPFGRPAAIRRYVTAYDLARTVGATRLLVDIDQALGTTKAAPVLADTRARVSALVDELDDLAMAGSAAYATGLLRDGDRLEEAQRVLYALAADLEALADGGVL
jgi:hypothetical protein